MALFQNTSDIRVMGAAHTAARAMRLAWKLAPDVVLMDATLPNFGAFRAARRILMRCPDTRLIFLDDAVWDPHVRKAIRVGGAGYWTKHAGFEELADAIRFAGTGRFVCCPAVQSRLFFTRTGLSLKPTPQNEVLGRLTPREAEVMMYLIEGYTVKECARQMRLAASTVDNHKARLMKKLGLRKTVDLVRLAVRQGIVVS